MRKPTWTFPESTWIYENPHGENPHGLHQNPHGFMKTHMENLTNSHMENFPHGENYPCG
jgi:hypothetical protein